MQSSEYFFILKNYILTQNLTKQHIITTMLLKGIRPQFISVLQK